MRRRRRDGGPAFSCRFGRRPKRPGARRATRSGGTPRRVHTAAEIRPTTADGGTRAERVTRFVCSLEGKRQPVIAGSSTSTATRSGSS